MGTRSEGEFRRLSREENERMRHCLGCKYMGVAGTCGCCNYYLETGIRRPCSFGQKCPVKALRKGYKLPPNYESWCENLDRRFAEQAKKKAREQAEREAAIRALLTEADDRSEQEIADRKSVSDSEKRDSFKYSAPRTIRWQKAPTQEQVDIAMGARKTESYLDTPISNKRGRRMKWDVDYAYSLYCSGYYICDIKEIIGLTGKELEAYIENHLWREFRDKNLPFRRADIPTERARYLKWKADKERLSSKGV